METCARGLDLRPRAPYGVPTWLVPTLAKYDSFHSRLVPTLAIYDTFHFRLVPTLAKYDSFHFRLEPTLAKYDSFHSSIVPTLAKRDSFQSSIVRLLPQYLLSACSVSTSPFESSPLSSALVRSVSESPLARQRH